MALFSILFNGGPTFTEGESGRQIKVKSSAVHGMCGDGGKTSRTALETDLKFSFSKSKLTCEILETDWSEKVSLDVPNDTVAHRARNFAGYYKKMPGGRSLKFEVAFSKITNVSVVAHNGSDAVKLALKDAACVTWFHNPLRSFGPWGERGGPFVKMADSLSMGASEMLFTWAHDDSSTSAAAFVQSLLNGRNNPPSNKKKPATSNNALGTVGSGGGDGGGGGSGGGGGGPSNLLLPLEGKSFVFTGDSSTRYGLERRVTSLGGKVTGAVSGRTAYLVAFDKTTVKYRKARDLCAAAATAAASKPGGGGTAGGPEIVSGGQLTALLAGAEEGRAAAAAELKKGGGKTHAQLKAGDEVAKADEEGPRKEVDLTGGGGASNDGGPCAKKARVIEEGGSEIVVID